MSAQRKPKSARDRELATIHIRAKELGLDRDAYEAMLWSVARQKSARDLDAAGRRRVLIHLGAGHKVRAAADRAPLIRKITMLLGPQRSEAYALGILKHMLGAAAPARLEWASPAQLRKVVAALEYDRRRHVQ